MTQTATTIEQPEVTNITIAWEEFPDIDLQDAGRRIVLDNAWADSIRFVNDDGEETYLESAHQLVTEDGAIYAIIDYILYADRAEEGYPMYDVRLVDPETDEEWFESLAELAANLETGDLRLDGFAPAGDFENSLGA